MSSPSEAFREAHERHEAAVEHGLRWVPLAAAVLAVLAAISGFLGNLRSTQALVAKNDAIVAVTRASDTYNEYESRSIKQHIYEAAIAAGRGGDVAKLRAIAAHESQGKVPVLAKARGYDDEAARQNERSERLLHAHEILEIATTLFEISIVLVSVTALVGSRLLPVVSVGAAAIGIAVLIAGALS